MAPEVVSRRQYGKPCDVWGAGVMLHVLLSGRLPFLGSGRRLQESIARARVSVSKTFAFFSQDCRFFIKKISFFFLLLLTINHNFFFHLSSRLQLDTPEWKSISSTGKDLVLKMLSLNPHHRPSISEILDHPWIRVMTFFYTLARLKNLEKCNP